MAGMQIAITGIDGSGKTTLIENLIRDLGDVGIKALKMDVPYFRNYYISNLCNKLTQRLWKFVELRQNKVMIICATILGLIIFTIFQFKREKDVVLVEHHPYIDVPVYANIYFGFSGSFFSKFAKCFWSPPDMVLFVDVPPEVCYQRILQRGSLPQPHETLEKLILIRQAIVTHLNRENIKLENPDQIVARIAFVNGGSCE